MRPSGPHEPLGTAGNCRTCRFAKEFLFPQPGFFPVGAPCRATAEGGLCFLCNAPRKRRNGNLKQGGKYHA